MAAITSSIRSAILGYAELFPSEGAALEPLVRSIRHGKGVTSRKQFGGHITCGAVLLSAAGSVLMIEHRKLERWLFPGGHVNPRDESLFAAAYRELREETGVSETDLVDAGAYWKTVPLHIDRHPIPESLTRQEPEHEHWDFRFLFRCDQASLKARPEEVKALKWVPLDRVVGPVGARLNSFVCSNTPPPFLCEILARYTVNESGIRLFGRDGRLRVSYLVDLRSAVHHHVYGRYLASLCAATLSSRLQISRIDSIVGIGSSNAVLAKLTADLLKKRSGIVRDSHGPVGFCEGEVRQSDRALLLDDIGFDGDLICDHVDRLRREGVHTEAVVCMIDRKEGDVAKKLSIMNTPYLHFYSLGDDELQDFRAKGEDDLGATQLEL